MEFKAIFMKAGKILDTYLPKNRDGSRKNSGFLKFRLLHEAEKAVHFSIGRKWKGKLLSGRISSRPEPIMTAAAEVVPPEAPQPEVLPGVAVALANVAPGFCSACGKRPALYQVLPCGHQVFCSSCKAEITELWQCPSCPICHYLVEYLGDNPWTAAH